MGMGEAILMMLMIPVMPWAVGAITGCWYGSLSPHVTRTEGVVVGAFAGVVVIAFGLLVYPNAYNIAPNLLPRVTWGLQGILWAFVVGAVALTIASCLVLHAVKARKQQVEV